MGDNDKKIRVGSRKSELALVQTRHVISLLAKLYPDKQFEIVTMSTLGDKILDIPLPKIGEKSLFTKELEASLMTGCIDFVVHSLKDLPTCLPTGMAIGAVLTREDPRDALILRTDIKANLLENLPFDSVIGTSSLRRAAQLARKHPHLKVECIRGNLNTRLKKLDELDKYHGIILAAAGIIRMGWTDRITKILDSEDLLYAVGQGALAVECRENDEDTINLLKPLYDIQTAIRIIAERSFLNTLGGGCSAPVAVTSTLTKINKARYHLQLQGGVWSLDGKDELLQTDQCTINIKDNLRCAVCPFNNVNKFELNDIENWKSCNDCPENPSNETPAKRLKLDNIPVEILKNDPHEQCPVQIPIGADFMGKCPYLEVHFKDHSDNKEKLLDISQCPFMRRQQLECNDEKNELIEENLKACTSKIKNYCGLVEYDSSIGEIQEAAENLGRKLAEDLINKGASEIMAKAQATIHGTTSKTTTVS